MRTQELIKSFSEDELAELSTIILKNKRPRLVQLFKELSDVRHEEKEPDNAALFEKAFGESYNKKKDYLLRNELRLLNEILYRFLAEKTALDHIDKYKRTFNFWLCNGYYQRGLHNLLRSDIDDLIKENSLNKMGQESMAIGDATAMLSLKSLWMIETQDKLLPNLEQQVAALKEWRRQEKVRFLYRLREIEAREAYLDVEISRAIGDPINADEDRRSAGETLIDLSNIDTNEPLLKYTLLKKHAYQTKGDKRIEVLQETLKLLEQKDAIAILGLRARFATLNQIGIESIMLGRYEEGNKYQEQYISQAQEHKWAQSFSMIHNYMVNQLNLRSYEKGIAIYHQYKSLIESNRMKYAGKLFLAYHHLYLGHDDEAIRLMPKESNLSLPLQIIRRFIYGISFLMRQEYSLAISELKNMKRTVKAIKTGDLSTQLFILDLYLRYATAHIESKEEKNRILSELKNEMKQNQAQWHIMAGVDVQLHWLMKKLEE